MNLLQQSISAKRRTEKILLITSFWVLVSLLKLFAGYSGILKAECESISPMIIEQMLYTVGINAFAGLIVSLLMVFLWERWLRSKSYLVALVSIFWTYSLLFILLSSIGFYLKSQVFQYPSDKIYVVQLIFLYGYDFLFWLIMIVVTLIALMVNDKYGPGVFPAFLMGRYFHPRREERIFMFLDLRGSTTIAEKLGEEQYFSFIRETFSDVTHAVLSSRAEIYQYVGDEIVLSWRVGDPVHNINSINCFYGIKKILAERERSYRKTYSNIVPEFKAGLHCGFAVVGEIGVVKKDIAYSGDVLNTTARIQSKCNEYEVDILVSEDLVSKLEKEASQFRPKWLGEASLTGREQTVGLYTLEANGS